MATMLYCDNFVGNVWKRDLCLNCFKSKEEHYMKNGEHLRFPLIIPDPPKEGILKGSRTSRQNPKGNKVNFLNNEFEVIGFGGDVLYSDEEEDEFTNSTCANAAEDEDAYDNEEDKAFQKLTKSNTDYNSIPENLQEPKEGEVKKVIEPLKLGRSLLDEKGNKKTLLVSVTPFGSQVNERNKINRNVVPKANELKDEKASDVPDILKSEMQMKFMKRGTKMMLDDKKQEERANGVVNKVEKHSDDDDGGDGDDDDGDDGEGDDIDLKSKVDVNSSEKSENENCLGEKDSEQNDGSIDDHAKSLTNGEREEFSQKDIEIDEKLNKMEEIPVPNTKTKRKAIPVPVSVSNPSDNLKIVGVSEPARPRPSENETESVADGSAEETEVAKSENPEKCSPGNCPQTKTNSDSDSQTVNAAGSPSKFIPNVSYLHRNVKSATPNEESVDKSEKEVYGGQVEDGHEDASVPEGKDGKVNGLVMSSEEIERFTNMTFQRIKNFERILKGEEITLFSIRGKMESEGKGKELQESENPKIIPELSRESAGEPDGKADSDDLSDPPALPVNPPPFAESRSNFLQNFENGSDFKMLSKKPKVPAKPIIVHSKKINFQSPLHTNRPKSPSIEKFLDMTSSPVQTQSPSVELVSGADLARSHKRQAPKPPSPKEEVSERTKRIFAEAGSEMGRQEEALEATEKATESIRRISRSTENLLEFITDKQDKAEMNSVTVEEITVPESTTRRSLSLSQDSLISSGIGEVQNKKKSSRGRFLLRKLLHLGKSKDFCKDGGSRSRGLLPPVSKPKLEIIHPSEFNGARIEILPPARSSKSRRSSSSASSSSGEQKESEVLSDSSTSHSGSSCGNDSHTLSDKTKKPLLPPRAQSLDCWSNKQSRSSLQKAEKFRQVNKYPWMASNETKTDSLYENLGEVRSGLAPNKPIRTGSLREQIAGDTKRFSPPSSSQPEDSGYESFDISFNTAQPAAASASNDDNVYECVQILQNRSASPECDTALLDCPNSNYSKAKRSTNSKIYNHRRSEGNYDLSQDYFKMKYFRSASLPYCSSETESEIYSSYSFYGSEVGEEDTDLSPNLGNALRISRLKLKKGRSVVHKNLEDNYGAVVIANHEALAQVVEQMRQGPSVPPALRTLCNAANLRWSDFTIMKDAVGVVVEKRVFYPAYWGAFSVTLSLTGEQELNSGFHAKGPFHLIPLTELNDLIPASYLPVSKNDTSEMVQASISVFTRLQIETLSTYGKALSSGSLGEDSKKEINFVLLQIINALKSLQAQGIEEAPKNLTNLIVCRDEKDPHPRICVVNSHERACSERSLCQCILDVISDVLPPTDLTKMVSGILKKEKAVSLSQAKAILEFTLWGPADIIFGHSARELPLQRWLDLERATVLHGLVRTRAELTVFEEWHLLFLVRTNAKMLADASLLLESGNSEMNSVC